MISPAEQKVCLLYFQQDHWKTKIVLWFAKQIAQSLLKGEAGKKLSMRKLGKGLSSCHDPLHSEKPETVSEPKQKEKRK